jgi:hypothetical protein
VKVLDGDKQQLADFVTIDLLKYDDDHPLWISKELETNAYGIDTQEFFL